ncbi:MAG TPA: hypothetical protein VE549_04100, partial [Myxococcaceae bacterium]|nr:hypothetical protein [Myxococcaceae bacterium]
VVVGSVKLETAGVDGTVDWLSEESRVVEATMTGGLATANVTLDAPAGIYKEIEVSIDKLELGKPEEEALITAYPQLADASIAVEGQVVENGSAEPFRFTAALDRDTEILVDPFLVVTGPMATTLAVDPAAWFRDADGNLVDPRDPANRSVIEENMQASVDAFLGQRGMPGPGAGPIMGFEIGRVRLVLGGVKLQTAGVDQTVDWVSEESLVLEGDLSAEPVSASTVLDVPPGTYKEIEISIDKLERGKPSEKHLLDRHPTMVDASIAIDGNIIRSTSREPFTFTAALDRDAKVMFRPFLVVTRSNGQGQVDVTLPLGSTRWFRSQGGGLLNPRDPANRSAIEENINASFRGTLVKDKKDKKAKKAKNK